VPLSIDSDLIAEKNKLSSSGTFLELMEIQLSEAGETLRYVLNNRTIRWRGNDWTPWPFQAAPVDETSDGDLPTFDVQVSNVGRIVQSYIEQAEDGLDGDTVIYRVVHSEYLNEGNDAVFLEETFQILGNRCDIEWVTFPLGAENFFFHRFPGNTFRRGICRYREFKGDECGYGGGQSSCNRTFATCISYNNANNFGGQPGISNGSFDV
jgi:lambda family phage minor tail protein L